MNKNPIADPRRDSNPNKNRGDLIKDKRERRKVLIRISSYMLRHKYMVVSAVLLMVISNLLALVAPGVSGLAIDAVAAGGGKEMIAKAGGYCLILALLFTVSGVLSYALTVLMIKLSQKIIYTMRREVFERLMSLPVSFFDTNATGDIISHISYDIDTINASLSHDLIQICVSVITVVISLVMMLIYSPVMCLVFAVTVPASIIFASFRSKKVRPLYRNRSAKFGELNGYAEEMLSGKRTINAYGREKVISGRFDKRNREASEAYYKAEYYSALMGPGVNFINNFSISMVTMLGGIFFMFYSANAAGISAIPAIFTLSLGGVSAFVQYSRKFAGPINEFANILSDIQSALAAADRVFKIIDEKPEKPDEKDAKTLSCCVGDVNLSHVKFGYTPEKMIIHDLSVDVKKGSTVAIVGPTGAGKTTIINLLMRFYDINGGKITVDGNDIYSLTRDSLRSAYTMVLQENWLFCASVRDNITYGREGASLEDVKKAARAAKIDSFIESLPNGYDTIISDGGINISKGQKQLITIARAMLADTPMLILDEATSNVDSRTEIQIHEAMQELMRERTAFVIAHRLSTIQNADTILVLQGGRVTEAGSHTELMKKGGFYASLYNAQFD